MRLIHRWALERPWAFAAGFALTASLLLRLAWFCILLVVMWIDTEGCSEHLRYKCLQVFCDWNWGEPQFGDIPVEMGGETERILCSPRYADYAIGTGVWMVIFAVLFSPVWGMMIMVVRALALRAKELERSASAPPTA